jgi:hypothetical protein
VLNEDLVGKLKTISINTEEEGEISPVPPQAEREEL